jgi:hypothetical protein
MNIARRNYMGSHSLRNEGTEIWRPFMPKNKKKRAQDLLARLVSASEKDVLGGLVLQLASGGPDVRRKCFEYLKKQVALPLNEKGKVSAQGCASAGGALANDCRYSSIRLPGMALTSPASGKA